MNTNHLHLNGYNSGFKPSQNNSGEAEQRKENYDNIVKSFKPKSSIKQAQKAGSRGPTERSYKYKQDITTTKPRKAGGKKKPTGQSAHLAKRPESEGRKPHLDPKAEPVTKPEPAQKRSTSQPPVEDPGLCEAKVEDYVTMYAYDTRTGMIPGKDDKQNQDRYFVISNFASIKNNWLFCVMDGHGVNGHFASEHVKQYLPANIELLDYMLLKEKYKEKAKGQDSSNVKDSGANSEDVASNYIKNTFNLEKPVEGEQLQPTLLSSDRREKYTVISEGFIKTAIDIQNRSFNVDFSGTTVVTVMLSGNQLTCANCGDSRAILGSLRTKEDAALVGDTKSEFQIESVAGPNSSGDKMWMCTALSIDHKPDRKDEDQRIMGGNGRVDPF